MYMNGFLIGQNIRYLLSKNVLSMSYLYLFLLSSDNYLKENTLHIQIDLVWSTFTCIIQTSTPIRLCLVLPLLLVL